jgi:uncharacterized membrane protein
MRNRGKVLTLLMSVCFIAATSTAAFAQTPEATTGKCGFQPLNFPPPADKGFPVALNDSGAIVGGFTDTKNVGHGFLLYQGRLTTFMFPGSSNTTVTDMSSNGIIVGDYSMAGDPKQHHYMVHSGGFHEITLPGFPNADFTVTGVNANGDVVGAINTDTTPTLGYLLHNGKVTTFSFPGADITLPTSINNEGVIVGGYLVLFVNENPAFMLKDGVFSNLDPPGSSGFVNATKVSNSGVVVGSYQAADTDTRGFALKNGTYTNIDAPGFPRETLIGAVNKFDNVLLQAEFNTQQGLNFIEFKGFCGAVF